MTPSISSDAVDSPDSSGPTPTRRKFLSSVGALAAGAATAGTGRASMGRGGPRYSVPDRRMRFAFEHEVDVIIDDQTPVDAVRGTIHPEAEYVGVVPGVTFTRAQYEEFLSLLREFLFDRHISLVGDGFVVTGPHTSRASWVFCGTLLDGTRLCLPARGSHEWAPNGKCIRATVTWLDPAATTAFAKEAVKHASSVVSAESVSASV